MYQTMMVNGPPPEYTPTVAPVVFTPKSTLLDQKDRRHTVRDRGGGRTRRKTKPKEEEDILFEPLLGKLFDYSA